MIPRPVYNEYIANIALNELMGRAASSEEPGPDRQTTPVGVRTLRSAYSVEMWSPSRGQEQAKASPPGTLCISMNKNHLPGYQLSAAPRAVQ